MKETADLVIFTEEIVNGKLHILRVRIQDPIKHSRLSSKAAHESCY